MRVLVDESPPVELADQIAGYDVATVGSEGWLGLGNGVPLARGRPAGFSIIVTADRDLPHQQNLAAIGISAVILAGVRNRIEDLRPLIPGILAAIARVRPGEAVEVGR